MWTKREVLSGPHIGIVREYYLGLAATDGAHARPSAEERERRNLRADCILVV